MVISGGQTGADLGGLIGAFNKGIATGGTAPFNYITEKGSNFDLRDKYKLIEGEQGYISRTVKNVNDSDLTVIFATKINSTGTKLTIKTCRENNKPYLLNPSLNELYLAVKRNNVSILNVAGNRESVSPGIQEASRKKIEGLIMCLFH